MAGPSIFRISSAAMSNPADQNEHKCPTCGQAFTAVPGRSKQCSTCETSARSTPQDADQSRRNCPGCGKAFSASSDTIAQCPACGRLVLFDDRRRRVAFEQGDLPNGKPLPSGEQSQATGSLPFARKKDRPAVLGPLIARQAARWLPYQAALEKQLVDLWPARLFTFTKHERWQLRASQREQFDFRQLHDPRFAKYLAASPGPVLLDSLESLAPAIARQLARTPFSIYLRGLTSLDTTTAATLAKHGGETLALDGLSSLSDDLAEALARHQGKGLSLDGLFRIEANTAAILAEYRGRLALNGLSSLTPAVAAELAEHRGKSLSFAGIQQLTPETARALARYEGDFYFEGLTELTGELAQAFHDFSGKLQLKFHEIRRRRRRRARRSEVGQPLSLFFLVAVAAVLIIACYELFAFLAELINNV